MVSETFPKFEFQEEPKTEIRKATSQQQQKPKFLNTIMDVIRL